MSNKSIKSNASKIRVSRKRIKLLRRALILIVFLFFIVYLIITLIFNSWGFTILLDKNLHSEKGILVYEKPTYKVYQSELYAETLEFIDNINGKWLPADLHEHEGGSNNGENYTAYTFFVEHQGEYVADYWWEINIDEVLKGVDEAIRIKVFKNDEEYTFAKIAKNGKPEPDTIPFESEEHVVIRHEEGFYPGDIHKFTVVIWLEGPDPECVDEIIGGHIKISMRFNSELVEK